MNLRSWWPWVSKRRLLNSCDQHQELVHEARVNFGRACWPWPLTGRDVAELQKQSADRLLWGRDWLFRIVKRLIEQENRDGEVPAEE